MRIESGTPYDVFKVAQRMREADVREFLALNRSKDREELAVSLTTRFGLHPDTIVATDDEREPIAIGGLIEHRPNVITLLCFATDRLPEIGLPLTRFLRQRLFPRYQAAGVHRIECLSIDGHTEAHRWIEALGLSKEAVCPGFGKGGETFHQFAWVADHVRQAGA